MLKHFLFICLLSVLFPVGIFAQQTFKGIVKDKATGETLPGAVIYIPDLKIGLTTNEAGEFHIENLPKSSLLVEVKFIGYQTIDEIVNFSEDKPREFLLSISAIEAKGVVITGSVLSSDNSRTSVSLVPIDRRELLTTPSTNIINALSNIPGISEISTGGAISKPVIRGLGYNRVVTMSEGVRQEGSQWGDEHGIEIDQFSVDKIEVLKGPASLFYGSDAIGGVLNILEPLPAPKGSVRGELGSNFSTNARLTGNSLMFEGNHNGLIFRLRGSYKNAASYQTPSEYVYNSGFNEKNLSLLTGLNKKWGFSHLHYSRYDAEVGLVEGERDSATKKFIDQLGNIVPDDILKGRNLNVPFQHITHDKLSWISNIIFGQKQLKVTAGYQVNDRKEYALTSSDPNMVLRLQTFTYDVKYQTPLGHRIEGVAGFSGMTQDNRNKGFEYLVPDFHLQDFGGFAYLKKNFERFTFNAGIRYDHRQIHGDHLTHINIYPLPVIVDTIFRSFTSDFSAISGAIGSTLKITDFLDVKMNIGRAFRAPNIAELASNGVHEGTFRYETGNTNLQPETSLQFDAEISLHDEYWNFLLSAYYNLINHYIYSRNINDEQRFVIADQHTYPVYRFVQGNSVVQGFEAALDIHPKDHFHFENSIALVKGTNESLNLPLPLIPATHTRHVFRWNIEVSRHSAFRAPYLKAGLDWYWKQDRIDLFETTTGSYELMSAGAGTDLKVGKYYMTIFIDGENLADVQYYDHLNRLKYVGVYNMGRNITLGVTIPFAIREK